MNYTIKYEEELAKIAKELEKIDTIDKMGELAKEKTIILIRESLEKLDERLFKDRKRKNEYESKGKDERTIVTLQGVIRYKRRRYKDKSTGRSVYLLDILIGVMKRKRYSEEVMKKAIINALEMRSYNQAGKKTLEHIKERITKSTIYNWLKKARFEEKEVKQKEAKAITISADGTFPHINGSSKNKELKVFNIYSEKEQVERRKNKLDSHIFSPRRQSNTNRLWEQVLEYIKKIFKIEAKKLDLIYI